MKKVLVFVLSAMLALCALSGCSALMGPDESGPISAIEAYYGALNAGDFDGMVASCDSATATALNGSMDLLSGLLSSGGDEEVDVRGFISALYPSLSSAAKEQGVTYEFTPKDYAVTFDGETRASVRYTLDAVVTSDEDSQTYAMAQEYNVIKEGDTWKIDLSDQLSDAFGTAFNIAGSLF